jgi:hypothetical protein
MLVFDLTRDCCASDRHISFPVNGSIRIELKYDETIAEALTILLYQDFDRSIQTDRLRNFTTDF